MMSMRIVFLFLLLIAQVSFAQKTTGELHIIPQPASVKRSTGQFILNKNTVITATDEADKKAARIFNDFLQQVYGFKLDIDRQESKNYIRLVTRKFIKAPDKDAYQLTVNKNGVRIEGDTYAGTFYGLQTLIQLLPTTNNKPLTTNLSIPFVTINDAPRFAYRGMHLDVSRHFSPVSFIRKYIDYLALHKLNTFHWHLTDDQGWRIKIKKHPRLTSVGGWRNGTIIGRYPGTGNDNQLYGGFYTQEEIKEVVQYAADRHINVIPEIEMPGHASAAIAAYPFLSCFPEEKTVIPTHPSNKSTLRQAQGDIKLVQETWGVFDDVFCAGKDSTFLLLQDVLDEVVQLFPSKYIHVGGDECPKNNWKRCPNCQKRIKDLGLKDEHELQSYFIQRMEKHLNAQGRTLIGWDEILEGGLAPNAVVMSWRGEKGGIEAAQQNHYVVMTPERPLYFDHTQTRNEDSVVIGGYNPIEKVYEYDPLPKELDSSKWKYVLGAQANLWREYIRYPSKVEYMVFPRMAALSEVLWSPKEKRSWIDFEKRLMMQMKRYDLWKVNYSKAYFDVKVSIQPTTANSGVLLSITKPDAKGEVTYQLVNRSYPFNYSRPVILTRSDNIAIKYWRENQVVNTVNLSFSFNKATGKKISIDTPPQPKYPGQGGAFSLVNGVWSNKGLSYPDWLGWIGDDIEATIDLGSMQTIDSVRMHTINQNGSWVYLPEYVEVSLSSDGKTFEPAGRTSTFVTDTLTMGWMTVPLNKKPARYVKLFAKNYGLIPEGKPGGGTKAWIFADEIQVY